MNNDLISRSALKATIMSKANGMEDLWDTAGVLNAINNAPTVDAIPNEEGYEMYNKGYKSGYELCKKNVIRSIAKQYSEHNELVPSWLHIGKMGEANNDKVNRC